MSWEGRPWVGILKVGVRALRWLLMGGDMGTELPSCFWAFSVDPEGKKEARERAASASVTPVPADGAFRVISES